MNPPSLSASTSPMEDDQIVHVIMLLDESGSMRSLKNDLVPSINTFIEKQRVTSTEEGAVKPSCDVFSLIKFNVNIRVVYDRVRMDRVGQITPDDFNPDNCTALFDAIGFVVEKYGQEKNTLLVIVTDGEENSSKKYKHLVQVREMLEKQKSENQWTVVYLSNNIDAFNQGRAVGCVSQSSNATQANTHNIQMQSNDMTTFLSRECSDAVSKYKFAKGFGGIAFDS